MEISNTIVCPVPECGHISEFFSGFLNHYKTDHKELIVKHERIGCVNKFCLSTFASLDAVHKHIKTTKCMPNIVMKPGEDKPRKTRYPDGPSYTPLCTTRVQYEEEAMSIDDCDQEVEQHRNFSLERELVQTEKIIRSYYSDPTQAAAGTAMYSCVGALAAA
ncbi:hypothetical protein DMENIID0001_144650 [Sergentomyia squamirostris]